MLAPKRLCLALTLLVLAFAAAAPARAAIINATIDFSATGFFTPAPVDPVIGSISITFDNAADISQTATGVTLNSINITFDPSDLAFIYDQSLDILYIGGTISGVTAIAAGFYDFALRIDDVSTAPDLTTFLYAQDAGGVFDANSITFSFGPLAVPEPSALALLAGGALAGGLIRRRKRA